MSTDALTALLVAPVMLAIASLFVFVVTGWLDRADRGKTPR